MKRSDISEKEIIDACNMFRESNNKDTRILKETRNTPDITLSNKYSAKIILAKMQQMVDKGILAYGVSLRTAWVKNY